MTNNHRQPYLVIVSALIQKEDEVLLVEQQWPTAPGPIWSLPGGRAEPGELLTEVLVREVREETGLAVLDPGKLLCVVQTHNAQRDQRTFSFVFQVAAWRGDIQIDDPDHLILRAAFLPRFQAITKLEHQRTGRVLREPLVAHLRGEATSGAIWLYRRQENGEDELTHRLNGLP